MYVINEFRKIEIGKFTKTFIKCVCQTWMEKFSAIVTLNFFHLHKYVNTWIINGIKHNLSCKFYFKILQIILIFYSLRLSDPDADVYEQQFTRFKIFIENSVEEYRVRKCLVFFTPKLSLDICERDKF